MRGALVTALLTAAIALCTRAAARPDAAIPVILVDAGRTPTAAQADLVSEGIASPSIRGGCLLQALGLRLDPEPRPEEIAARHREALDLYYAGSHGEAGVRFEQVFEEITDRPVVMSREPSLREIAFEAAMHAAMIPGQTERGTATDEWIGMAVSRFPDLHPAPADYPPWLRERFEEVKATADIRSARVRMVAPAGCQLVIDGKVVKAGNVARVPEGVLVSAMARCHGRFSPAATIRAAKEEVAFTPIVLAGSSLDRTKEDAVLIIDDGADGDDDAGRILDDVLAIARAGGWGRAIALVGRPDSLEVLLVDERSSRIARRDSGPAEDPDAAARLTSSLLPKADTVPLRSDGGVATDRKWYRDGLAWTLLGTGLAALGAGIAVGQVYGAPSSQEPAAWALMLGGGAIAGTGAILFAVPAEANRTNRREGTGVLVGAAASWTF